MILGINLLKECDADLEDVLHIRCATHILNLVVEAGLEQDQLKTSISKIRYYCKRVHASVKLTEYLETQTNIFKEPSIKVVLDVETRWNSTHDMIKTSLRIFKSLKSISVHLKQMSDSMFDIIDDNDYENAVIVSDFLEPFYQGNFVFFSK